MQSKPHTNVGEELGGVDGHGEGRKERGRNGERPLGRGAGVFKEVRREGS